MTGPTGSGKSTTLAAMVDTMKKLGAAIGAAVLLIASSACAAQLPTKFTVKFCLDDTGKTNTNWDFKADNLSDPIKTNVVVQAPVVLKGRSVRVETTTIKLDQDIGDGKVSGSGDVALLEGVHRLYIVQGKALGDTGGSISVHLRTVSSTESPSAPPGLCA